MLCSAPVCVKRKSHLDTLVFFSPVQPPLDLEPWPAPRGFSLGSSHYRGPGFLTDSRWETNFRDLLGSFKTFLQWKTDESYKCFLIRQNAHTDSPWASSAWTGMVLSAEAPHGPTSSALLQRWPGVLRTPSHTLLVETRINPPLKIVSESQWFARTQNELAETNVEAKTSVILFPWTEGSGRSFLSKSYWRGMNISDKQVQ